MSALTQVGGNAIYDAATPTPPNAVPATIAASISYQTGFMPCMGYAGLAAAATLSQAGTISIQRYMDAAGAYPIGAAISTTMSTPGTLYTAAVRDGLPCAFWQVTVTNTGASTAGVSAFSLLQNR